MLWENAKECAENTPTEELLQLYLYERDRKDFSDAAAIREEIQNRGLDVRCSWGHYSLVDKEREDKEIDL